jgi:hypothetical protein
LVAPRRARRRGNDNGGNILYNEFDNGTLTVEPVPLPAAAWLLVSGAGLIGATRRRLPFSRQA